MNIRCFVVDDEPLATSLLKNYIERLPNWELVGVSNNPQQALNFLKYACVDVLFLDIQMPQLSGFELVRPLSYRPKIIFTTAFREYALESYEFDVVDYLVKPIYYDRFLQAIDKLNRFLSLSETAGPGLEPIKAGRDYQYFRVNKEMVKVFLEDIMWIEGVKDYVRIHTVSGSLVCYLRISYLEEKLPLDRFVRIHKSFIISLYHLQSVSASFVRVNAQELPIGRSYKAKLEAWLNER